MSDKEVPRKRCSDCAHSETPLRLEPCRTCYGNQDRCKFVARTPAVATAETVAASDARDEDVSDEVVCHGCVHSETPLRREPCRTCFRDPARPGFRKKAVTPAESDEVEHPAHYTRGAVECIDAIEAAVTGLEGVEAVLTGQVLKYLWRWRHKGHPLEDLRKARWYLDRLLARAGGGPK